MSFKHLNLEEREVLYGLLKEGLSLRSIANKLGRHHSTLSRELKTNARPLIGNKTGQRDYLPCKAQEKVVRRASRQRTKAPLKNPLVFTYVREHLRDPYNWTPEQIANRLPLDNPGYLIDDETIYRYIYSKRAAWYKLWELLPQARKKRMKKEGRRVHREGKIPFATSIDQRPKEVEERTQPGHWETDNVIGKQTDQTALSVTVERVVRFTLLTKLADRGARAKTEALKRRLQKIPKELRLTLTTDNGKENSYHQEITRDLGIQVFFCHAYHSWEKGTVENTNGRLRRYLPKGIGLDTVTPRQIQALEEKLNNTPRKCLGYLTPKEALSKLLLYQ